ncbi:2'-5' RNA ligase family protein [Frankia sp. Cr1]|uniref:2'-5' RNA ligase family protein n=1 Tax=Frankia sp. Cr1 TaxID=3073931 RepID=UPI002AD21D51|nr:2'-5' RNA ligase family protein [Frankia sp. Cr1]
MTVAPTADPVAEDWHRFAALDTLTNHWDRPGWTPGRRSYHWMLTFEDADELCDLAARCQARLHLPVLDPVPADGLHLTLQRLAFADETTTIEVEKAVNETRQQLSDVQTFALTVGPLAGSSGAVRFSVVPWEPVIDLRNRIINATAATLGPAAAIAKPHGFRPHVGIAYCNSPTDARPIIQAVEALRELPRAGVLIKAVALVELRREGRTYRWETVTRLPLADLPLAPPRR